jgi:RNA recognition motif-containing protein
MKLYVGNLPYDARDEELRQLFATHGTIATALVVVDRLKDRSRGFGFVEFDDPNQGRAAITAVHGQEFGGRTLVCNEARSQGGGSSDRRGPRGGYGGHSGPPRENRGFGGGRRF